MLKAFLASSVGPFERPIEYSPTDKATLDHDLAVAKRMLQPHTLLTQVLSSRFQAVKYRDRGITLAFFRLLTQSFKAHKRMRQVLEVYSTRTIQIDRFGVAHIHWHVKSDFP